MNWRRAISRHLAVPALAGLAALTATGGADPLSAQGWQGRRQDGFPQSRPHSAPQQQHGVPMLAVVALGEQRITIYNATGKMLQAPVSTGSTGYETPAGIFSIVQKKEDHESNLYEDGKMPFMQRITWTGIALHAGQLPGHPASHGCVRMPLPFAERLFPMTDLGMRVIIVRDDIVPSDITHPLLFGSTRREAALTVHSDAAPPGSAKHLHALKSLAAAKATDADLAARRAGEAKRAAASKAAEAAMSAKAVRIAQAELAKGQEQLKAAERALEATVTAQQSGPAGNSANEKKAGLAEQRAQKARSRISEIEAQFQAVKAKAQARAEAAERALEDAKAADKAKDAATDAADEAKRKAQPVSMFISRKTQRYYVRQGFQPVHEGPVTIRDAGRPVGTYVFTALSAGSGGEMHWNVVSMYKSGATVQPVAAGVRRSSLHDGPAPADVAGAKAALDRIVLPQDALERISEVVLPGSSLIISDEGPSIETGKDTDFVVVMSGEPQGALKARKREPFGKFGDDDDFFGRPFSGSRYGPSSRNRFRGFPFFN